MTGLAQRQPSGPVRWGLPAGRAGFATLVAFYAVLVALCLATLVAAGDLSFGRNPWDNLLKTVGEFVEDDPILQELLGLGVDFAQGYLIHRPEPLGRLLGLTE